MRATRVTLMAILAAMTVLAVACGGDASDDAATDDSSEAATAGAVV